MSHIACSPYSSYELRYKIPPKNLTAFLLGRLRTKSSDLMFNSSSKRKAQVRHSSHTGFNRPRGCSTHQPGREPVSGTRGRPIGRSGAERERCRPLPAGPGVRSGASRAPLGYPGCSPSSEGKIQVRRSLLAVRLLSWEAKQQQ